MRTSHLFKLLILGISCRFALSQTTIPSPASPPASPETIQDESDAELIFLASLPQLTDPNAISSYARQSYIKAELIKDPEILKIIRLSLSKLEIQPDKAAQIRLEHLHLLSEYFTQMGLSSQEAGNLQDALRLAQLAVRCNPGNAKSKLFYSNILHTFLGNTDDAINTLKHGLEFLKIDDGLTKNYLERYFQLLQSRERDTEVINDSLKLLTNWKNITPSTREVLALAAATSLYWIGNYPDSVNLINSNNLDSNPSGTLLKARALFDGGKTQEALSFLAAKVSSFKGTSRDAMLSQLYRFHILLGQNKIALSVIQERIDTDENAPFPQIHKLQLLDRIGNQDEFGKQLNLVFTRFLKSSAAMIALANFAAEKGYSEITAAIIANADQQGFERATFATLHLEALARGPNPALAIEQYKQIMASDRAYFKSKEPFVQALIGIAYHARPKSNPAAAKVDRETGNLYLSEFLKTKNLGPEAYRSVGRLLRIIRAADAAVFVLEAGVLNHPRHSQLRADYIVARILAGQSEAIGNRKPIADEIESLLTMRRPSPAVWQTATSWLRNESKLPKERQRKLEAACSSLMRSNLDLEAVEGF